MSTPAAPTVVLVPGACHGGWWYDPVVDALTADGQPAAAVTLPGLEQHPTLDRLIALDTHVEHTLAALPDDGQVVLGGHSYAGMVITAVDAVIVTGDADLLEADLMPPAITPRAARQTWLDVTTHPPPQ